MRNAGRDHALLAPGAHASGEAVRLPGRDPEPRVDDYLIAPGIRKEIVGGRVYRAMPADPPHAIQHSRLDYVLRAKAAPGYLTANDLKTRFDRESDFASDVSILKEGIDPTTGARYLEELAFEVVSAQNAKVVRAKAPRMHRRGVRRIFVIFVKKGQVCEWSPGENDWRVLDRASSIVDPCLVEPLEVAALLDAAAADDSVVRALTTKGNPAIVRLKEESQTEGRAEGTAEAILTVLDARGLAPDEALRRRILSCTDPHLLGLWLRRAAVKPSAAEVVEDPGRP